MFFRHPFTVLTVTMSERAICWLETSEVEHAQYLDLPTVEVGRERSAWLLVLGEGDQG